MRSRSFTITQSSDAELTAMPAASISTLPHQHPEAIVDANPKCRFRPSPAHLVSAYTLIGTAPPQAPAPLLCPTQFMVLWVTSYSRQAPTRRFHRFWPGQNLETRCLTPITLRPSLPSLALPQEASLVETCCRLIGRRLFHPQQDSIAEEIMTRMSAVPLCRTLCSMTHEKPLSVSSCSVFEDDLHPTYGGLLPPHQSRPLSVVSLGSAHSSMTG